jgi:SAM-dependent methyltransferase
MLKPDPSVSPHYVGERGARYAQWQVGLASAMGVVSSRKFSPFVTAEDTVLDFGCGGGYILLALQCARRLGIEPNEAALKVARANGIDVFPSIAMVSPRTADVVITSHALEHTTRPFDELRSIRAVLKPTGRLVMVLPIDDWRTQRHYDPRDINNHLYTWTPQLLGNLLADVGFSLEHIGVLTHAWPPGFRIWRQFPAPVFDALCFAWAILRRRRQIYAVAVLAT